MRKPWIVVGAGVLGLVLVSAPWPRLGAQSTQVVQFVRDVNSNALLEAAQTSSSGVGTLVDNLSQDAVHDEAALTTGPQGMGECDDTSTDAVDEGDAGRVRVNCTTRALLTSPTAINTNGADSVRFTVDNTNDDDKHSVCTGPCNLYSVTATNTAATVAYLRCENDTSGNTSPGSETPELDLAIPGNTTGAGITFSFPVGAYFSTALTCWIATGEAATDQTDAGENDVKLFYTRKQ